MSARYYNSSEEEIQPGKISRELREALNIPENDIPIWIYRMRALGYPPGWLQKAVVDTNDIFDTDPSPSLAEDDTDKGNKKRKQPSNDEHPFQQQNQVQYDHSKLIEYPGFNAPMPKNCHDYHYYVNMPAMLEHQQLDYAKKHMPMHEIKKLKRQNPSSDESSSDEVNNNDNSPQRNSDSSETSVKIVEEIKLLSKGSPMPKPVERAPLENFSEGVVGELLYFENLPSSTGKFESIRGLLNTIRQSKRPEATIDKNVTI